jgi:hypothetical protein
VQCRRADHLCGAGGRPAHLQRGARKKPDEEPADDARDDPSAGGTVEAIEMPLQRGIAAKKTTTDATRSVLIPRRSAEC